ncbi:MAG: hypothetical protein ACM3MD_08360 [Betaproteobacteria bacterium]
MKIMITVLMVVVLALTVGVAYAESGMTATKAEIPLFNGITYFDLGPASDCASVRGTSAGGVISVAEPVLNRVTYFETGIPGSRPTGLCAGSISEEKPGVLMNNGITVF